VNVYFLYFRVVRVIQKSISRVTGVTMAYRYRVTGVVWLLTFRVIRVMVD
jgi:hypothetical protein